MSRKQRLARVPCKQRLNRDDPIREGHLPGRLGAIQAVVSLRWNPRTVDGAVI
jgi:hypothetical protein